MRPDCVMIFAAGFGTRMGALTKRVPKPLLPLSGTTLLDRTLWFAEDAGIRRRFVNAHYLADALERHVAGLDVTVLREEPDILDTGGGIKAALPHLGPGPVFTANPDVAWRGPNPFTTLAATEATDADAVLLLVPPERTRGRDGPGDFALSADGALSRGGPMVYTGVQIIRTEPVAAIPGRVFSLNVVWDRLLATGRIRGTVYPGDWCDAGTPEGLAEGERMLREARDA